MSSRKPAGRIRASTPTSTHSNRRCRISRPSSTAPARSPRTSASRCRARCWCGTAILRSPRRSWPPGWVVRGAARSEPCPPGWISRRSSSVQWSRDDPLYGRADAKLPILTRFWAVLRLLAQGSGGMTHAIRPVDFDNLKTMTYEVTDRVARITFNRPEKGNAIIADTPLELSALVERADLDPGVHAILVSGRGEGFCAGFDLSAYAEGSSSAGGGSPYTDTVLSGRTQAINHLPDQPWDPMIDYQMMSRFVRGFASLLHADKPTVVKIHGYCVAGGTDIALHADQVIAAADAKIGYPPTRVWGVPATGLWAHRLGDQRAKRLLFTGDCISGAQAAEWGLAAEAPEPADLDERTERLVERIAAMPVNQLIMAKLALNTALLQQGVATSRMVSTVFDGVARHTPEGHAFVAEARDHGFREAVRQRDEPFGDHGRKASEV